MKYDDYISKFKANYAALAVEVAHILESGIRAGDPPLRFLAVQHRAKSPASLKHKLEDRDLLDAPQIELEIKDLAGVRLLLYTETDVDRFLQSGVIADLFEVDWKEMRAHYPIDENDQQRYQGFHYVVSLKADAPELAENPKLAALRCEIQIQTVLNHGWSEPYHDMIYKARGSAGFGTRQRDALDHRMKQLMDDHLRPAAYELQKAQHDHERLVTGKTLFDRGSLETLAKAHDNNERAEILKTISEFVLPNYDDVAGVCGEVERALLDAVTAARRTETKPVVTPFGNIEGKTCEAIAILAVNILSYLRYADPKGIFHALCDIYKDETSDTVRKHIADTVERLAQYDLDLWRKMGPAIQLILADAVDAISPESVVMLRPLIIVVWRELLESRLDGRTWAADSVTLHQGVLPVNSEVAAIRDRAIAGLTRLLDQSSTESDQRQVFSALHAASQLPTQGACSNELYARALEDTATIADTFTQRAEKFSYELLQHIEHRLLYDYRRAGAFIPDEENKFGCQGAAEKAIRAILSFRDAINGDENYIRYKILVGFESTFKPHWDSDGFDYRGVESYRKSHIRRYISEFSDDKAEEWRRTIERCASTQSNDLATFPLFGGFLQQLAKAYPSFTLDLVRRADENVMQFLPALLSGLFESDAKEDYERLVGDYLKRGVYVFRVARHCRVVGATLSATVEATLRRAIQLGDIGAVAECVAFALEYHATDTLPLVDAILVPAIEHLTLANNPNWIHNSWFIRGAEPVFENLSARQASLVLNNLVILPKIGSETEFVLLPLAKSHLEQVWSFFGRRLEHERSRNDNDDSLENRYEAIPYALYHVKDRLASDVSLAVKSVRKWYQSGDELFQYTGSRLLHAVIPAFSAELGAALMSLVATGERGDIEFALLVLRNYVGEPETHMLIQDIICRLPKDDRLLSQVDVCLSETGVVSGQFGMVEANRNKRTAMDAWKDDERPRVREYAAAYMQRLKQHIAVEQRRAEQDRELRKREYDDE